MPWQRRAWTKVKRKALGEWWIKNSLIWKRLAAALSSFSACACDLCLEHKTPPKSSAFSARALFQRISKQRDGRKYPFGVFGLFVMLGMFGEVRFLV